MPLLTRPDGARLHWEESGDGPGVLICNMFNSAPADGLIERLARERRVLSYDLRGVGRSSPTGPYDLATGVDDVEALVEERGPVEVALGIGDGAHRALRLADRRPDLVERVVITSTGLGRGRHESDVPGFGGSVEVLAALMGLLQRDFRSGLRSMVAASGFESEDMIRQRVEELAGMIEPDAAVGHLEAWMAAGSAGVARRLGGRLTVLAYPGNDWFPLSMYEEMRDHLTEACFELVEDGPMNRPDQAAEVLLRVSAPATG